MHFTFMDPTKRRAEHYQEFLTAGEVMILFDSKLIPYGAENNVPIKSPKKK